MGNIIIGLIFAAIVGFAGYKALSDAKNSKCSCSSSCSKKNTCNSKYNVN